MFEKNIYCVSELSMFVDNLLNTSSGVSKLRAFLDLLLSRVSTSLTSLEVVSKKLSVLGKLLPN